MIIHYRDQGIIVDPCLNKKGSLLPYTLFRKRPQFNPTVDLLPAAESAFSRITCGLITHCRYGHFDHLDKSGIRLLVQKQVPVYCSSLDEAFLRKRRIKSIPLKINQKNEFLTGIITPFPTKHGHGIIGKFMGHGAGYFIELPGDKTIYISGDTVMNQTVRNVLKDLRPDISILNAGTATLDLGRPILMPLNEIMDFIKAAPGKVVAVHLDAFNHCLTTRSILRDAVLKEGVSGKVMIPADGELMEF
jgi:L-ascorbate metabolism protein UlaG (beta-lactamase superfamily)